MARRAAGRRRSSPLESVMELATDAIVVMNDAGQIVSWNSGAREVFGYEPREVYGATIWSMMPGGHEDEYARRFLDLAEGRIQPPRHPVEIVAMRRDGSTFPTELSISTWKERRSAYVCCIFRDVSQRRCVEEQLRASNELFAAVLNGASQSSIIATDERGMITVFNRGAERLLGYDAYEACGLDLLALHDPSEIAARALELGVRDGLDALVSAARRGEAETREWTYVGKDVDLPVSLTMTAMTDGDELRGFIAVAKDLSAQRRAERRMEWANEAFRNAFDSAPVAVVLTRSDMTCAHANPAFCELTGYTPEMLAEMSMLDLLVTDDDLDGAEILERQSASFADVLDGTASLHRGECRVRRADGSAVWVRVHTSLVTRKNGEPMLWVSHLEDVTQEHRAEQTLREALARKIQALDHLEELDRAKSDFVSMVSHELRTPVTSVIGYVELLLDGSYGRLNPAQGRALEVVARNAASLNFLISDLMMRAKLDTGSLATLDETSRVDVAAVVAHVIDAMEPLMARRRLECTLNIDEDCGAVLGNERRLEHAVSNLLTNANKFTPEGGAVRVDVATRGLDVIVAVHDTGVGIPKEELPRVFSRFYRGRDAAKVAGTGLGLSIVRAIVQQHGGEVSIKSEVGAGTTVTLALPAIDESRPPAATASCEVRQP
jgi:PAS domain S-box-containing protein